MSARALVWLGLVLVLATVSAAPLMAQQDAEHEEEASLAVSLEAVLAHARENAPAIRVAVARLAIGEAAQIREAPDFPGNPELEVSAGPRVTQSAVDADITASLIQPLEIAGEPGARRAAAARTAGRLEAELARARWQVEQEVDAAYWAAVVARERAGAAREALAFAEEIAAIVARRVEIGEGAPLEARLARIDVAQARQAAITIEQEYLSARLTLAALAGLSAEPIPSPSDPLTTAIPEPLDLDRLLERAESRSPEILVLEAALEETEARLEAAERDAWPEPWIGLQYVREGSQGPGQFASDVGMVVLGIPLPFFHTNQGDRAEAHAMVALARAELESARQQLRPRIALARSVLVAAARRLEIYLAEMLPELSQTLEMVRRAYELGELDVLEVGIARDRVLRMQREALDAFIAYHRAIADLEREVGDELSSAAGGSAGEQ